MIENKEEWSCKLQFCYVTQDQVPRLSDTHPELSGAVSQIVPAGLEENPVGYPDFPCFCYMLDQGKVVSYFKSTPDKLYYQGGAFNWAWCGDLFTDPQYRGRGLAKMLVSEQVSLLHSKNIGWGGVFSTPIAIELYRKLGFCVTGYADRYVMVRNVEPFLRHYTANTYFLGVANSAYQLAQRTIFGMLNNERRFPKSFTVQKLEMRDESVFEEIVYEGEYHFNDSVEMIRWKASNRGIDEIYIVRSTVDRRPLFYMVMRVRLISKRPLFERFKNFNSMTLMDFGLFEFSENIHDTLISSALSVFLESGADIFEFVSSNPKLTRSAKKSGMLKMGKGMSFKFNAPSDWNLGQGSCDIHNWHLTHYSGDAFAFE